MRFSRKKCSTFACRSALKLATATSLCIFTCPWCLERSSYLICRKLCHLFLKHWQMRTSSFYSSFIHSFNDSFLHLDTSERLHLKLVNGLLLSTAHMHGDYCCRNCKWLYTMKTGESDMRPSRLLETSCSIYQVEQKNFRRDPLSPVHSLLFIQYYVSFFHFIQYFYIYL